MSHRLIIFLDPHRNDDDLAGWTDLDDAAGRVPVERLACDDVFALVRLRIALSLEDFTAEDDVFNVEDADFVIVKLIGCVEGDHVLAGSDFLSETVDDPAWHRKPILAR